MNGIESSYVQTPNLRFHCLSAGKGPLILFLHGFPEFSYMWRAQLKEFSKTHYAVAPDMRGYNLTEKPEGVEAYRLERLIQDVGELATALAHDKCPLAAHEWV